MCTTNNSTTGYYTTNSSKITFSDTIFNSIHLTINKSISSTTSTSTTNSSTTSSNITNCNPTSGNHIITSNNSSSYNRISKSWINCFTICSLPTLNDCIDNNQIRNDTFNSSLFYNTSIIIFLTRYITRSYYTINNFTISNLAIMSFPIDYCNRMPMRISTCSNTIYCISTIDISINNISFYNITILINSSICNNSIFNYLSYCSTIAMKTIINCRVFFRILLI